MRDIVKILEERGVFFVMSTEKKMVILITRINKFSRTPTHKLLLVSKSFTTRTSFICNKTNITKNTALVRKLSQLLIVRIYLKEKKERLNASLSISYIYVSNSSLNTFIT